MHPSVAQPTASWDASDTLPSHLRPHEQTQHHLKTSTHVKRAQQQQQQQHRQHQPPAAQSSFGRQQLQRLISRVSSHRAQKAQRCHTYGSCSSSADTEHTTTPLVWLVVWSIACAGFLVGYSSGANVAVAHTFRHLFLPQLPAYKVSLDGEAAAHCGQQVYRITWYLAPKYLAGFLAALPVGWLIRVAGRRTSLLLGCGAFMVAHLLRGTSSSLAVLLLGQAVDGIACAFLYQAPYLEAAEVAPRKWRGAFGYSVQLGRSMGLFCRSLLTQGLAMQPSSPPWGWRLAVLFPIWPAFVIVLLVPLLPETPSSLMQRGQLAAARAALQEIRGPLVDVEDEYDNILEAAGIKEGQGQPPLSQVRALFQRHQLPPLIILLVMTLIREFTGSDFLLQYSQALRLGMGLEETSNVFLLRQLANVGFLAGAVLGCLLFDTWGRRPTLLLGSIGSCCCYTALAAVLTAHHPLLHQNAMDDNIKAIAAPLLALMQASVILAYFFYSVAWAMGYLVLMAELFPLATRSLAMSVSQGLTFAMYAVSAVSGLTLACEMRVGLLWLYAATNALATVFVYLCLPETKRVPLEAVRRTFQHPPHWLWRHFCNNSRNSLRRSNRHIGR